MIKLKGDNGDVLSLQLVGYQFPHIKEFPDSGWVIVSGFVSCRRGTWFFRQPCLDTSEAQQLANWLRSEYHELEFTEPNLGFRRDDGKLIVRLSHECAPPDATEDEKIGTGVSLVFPRYLNDYNKLAQSLEEDLTWLMSWRR